VNGSAAVIPLFGNIVRRHGVPVGLTRRADPADTILMHPFRDLVALGIHALYISIVISLLRFPAILLTGTGT
jgi:hypothetical protein